MKKILSITLCSVFLIGIALAYGDPAEKATGGFTTNKYLNMNDNFEFNAQETDADSYLGSGTVNYARNDQLLYTYALKYVRVEPADHVAWFAGQVTETTNGENLGRWMVFVVCDEDSEKCTTDRQGYEWIPTDNMTAEEQESIALDWVTNGFPNPYESTLPVVAGNLVVH